MQRTIDAGWTSVPGLLRAEDARALADVCEAALATLGDDLRPGDKPHAGTRRLVEVTERVRRVAAVAADPRLVEPVRARLGTDVELGGAVFRSPRPGFGEQRLHADDIPMLVLGPDRFVTAIVALTDFTETNGATRIVPGSHRRPDLQRRSGKLDSHPDEIVLEGAAGTAFVFSGHLLHAGTRNRSNRPRPALQFSFGPVRSS